MEGTLNGTLRPRPALLLFGVIRLWRRPSVFCPRGLDFGSLASGGWNSQDAAIATASYSVVYDYSDARYYMKESDTRFENPPVAHGDTYAWSTDGSPSATELDVYSVAAHEGGHNIGLGHADSSGWLTMAPVYHPGTLNQRTLGRGDVLGMRALYP